MNKKIEMHRDEDGSLTMDQHNITIFCEQDGLYDLPDLNSKLYLHFKGFRRIRGLDAYVSVKVLWLENNFISKIEGLTNLKQLTNLYLQNNLIEEIEGLDENINLMHLNLSSNRIRVIKNMTHLKKLENFNISTNKISMAQDIQELIENTSLSTLDLQNNFLKYEPIMEERHYFQIDQLLRVFMQMPSLKCLYLQSNDYVRECVNYRKVFVGCLKQLTYLDNKPVTLKERQMCEAFVLGGKNLEQMAKDEITKKEQKEKQDRSEQIRKTIPTHLKKQIVFFQKSIDSINEDIDELQKQKARLICVDGSSGQIQYIEEQIQKKQRELEEMQEMVDKMKSRIDVQQLQEQEQTQQSQQNTTTQSNDFDELD